MSDQSKKIHFVLDNNSKIGVCGLKHANLVTTDLEVFLKHTFKCTRCFRVVSKLSKQFKKENMEKLEED
jgi:hypothetical protein